MRMARNQISDKMDGFVPPTDTILVFVLTLGLSFHPQRAKPIPGAASLTSGAIVCPQLHWRKPKGSRIQLSAHLKHMCTDLHPSIRVLPCLFDEATLALQMTAGFGSEHDTGREFGPECLGP